MKARSLWVGVGAVVAAAAVVYLTINGGNAPATAATPAVSTISLTEGVQVEPNWWFPIDPGQYCTTVNGAFSSMAYRPLVWISNTDTLDFGQSIASGISVNKADDVFTVTIGHRYQWSNGQPVTAQDALYGAEILYHTSVPGSDWTQCGEGIGGWPSDIKSITSPSPSTLVFTTKVPVNPVWFEHNGIGQVIPVPKATWDHSSNWLTEEKWILQVGISNTSPEFNVVDGPYRYGAFSNDAYATLVKNPKYTGPNPAHIKTIRFLYETSDSNLWAAALRGTFAEVGIPSQYTAQRSTLAREAHMKVSVSPYGFCFNYMQPDLNAAAPQHALLQKLYIRQAMQMAINQPQMVTLNGGLGYSITGPVPKIPRTPYYDQKTQADAYRFDPAAAKSLLEAHGWTMRHGVMTNQAGQTLTFKMLYLSGSAWVTNSVQLWQSNLRQEGIVLTLDSEEFNQMVTTVDTTHSWEIAWWGGGWCYEPDYYPTGAGLFEPGSSANSGDFNSPALTRLIQATHAPGTAKQEQQRMDRYQLLAEKLLPDFWVAEPGAYQARAPWLSIPANSFNPVLAETQFNLWSTTAH